MDTCSIILDRCKGHLGRAYSNQFWYHTVCIYPCMDMHCYCTEFNLHSRNTRYVSVHS